MSHKLLRALALGFGASLLLASGAQAQRGRRAEAAPPAPQVRYEPGRGSASYTVPPGYRGIITASTPNESGNLGGPSAGGGSGGGGK